jgi:hypothetical protein
MEYRATATDPPRTMAWDEFETMVGRGEVAPTALVRARVITGEDWWTADNLSLFHRVSPVKYPFGQYLVAELERKRQRQEQAARETAFFAPYYRAYEDGSLIEDFYDLTPLATLVAGPAVMGASRLIVMPSFAPERVVTCVLTPSGVRVDAVTAMTTVLGSILSPLFEGTGEESRFVGTGKASREELRMACPPELIRSATTELTFDRAPRLFRSWEALVDAVHVAPTCHGRGVLDGTYYRHIVRGGDVHVDTKWDSPRLGPDPGQTALVAAYAELVAATGLVVLSRR